MANYYEVLGVNVFADQREIKARYKKLAIQFHPDKHGGNKDYEEKFKAINEAFQVLSNPTLRNRYDHKMFYSQPVESTVYTTTHTQRPAQKRSYAKTKPRKKKVEYTARQIAMAVGLFVVLVSGAIGLYFGMNSYAGKKYFQEGETYFKQKSFELAMSKYMEVLQINPAHPQANERVGDIMIEYMGDTEMGLIFYQNAFQENENPSSELYYKTCKTLIVEGKSGEAIQQLEKMLVLYPKHHKGWCLLGEILIGEMKFNKANEAYQIANSLVSNYESLYGCALSEFMIGGFDKTISHCNQILEMKSNDPAGIMLRGRSYLSLGDSISACQDFARADMYNFPTAQNYKASVCKNF